MGKRETDQTRYMRWLRLVWKALSEEDRQDRDSKLRAADALLRMPPKQASRSKRAGSMSWGFSAAGCLITLENLINHPVEPNQALRKSQWTPVPSVRHAVASGLRRSQTREASCPPWGGM